MNSEGRMGVTIEWLKTPENRDYNNLVEGVDYIVRNPNKMCPVTDGSPVTFIGIPNAENYEWLIRSAGVSPSAEIDYNIYYENIVTRPSNIKDSVLVNYNLFITEHIPVRRTNEEIIQVIREKENEANNAVLMEAERNKLQMLAPAITLKVAQGKSLNTEENKVLTIIGQVSEKAMLNASNAASLIQQIEAGNTPDISVGWEYDNISVVGYPFAD